MTIRWFSLFWFLPLLMSCQEESDIVKSNLYKRSCPENFTYISKRYDLETPGFCISRDLMAFDGNQLTVRKNNLFAITVSHDEAQDLCQSLGSRYDLVTLAEYQAAALEVELLDANWSGGWITLGSLALSGGPVKTLSGETLDGLGNNVRNGISDASSSWIKEYRYSYFTPGYSFDVKAGEFYTYNLPTVPFNAPYDDVGKWFAPKGDYAAIASMAMGDGGFGELYLDGGSGFIVRGAFARKPFNAEFKTPATISGDIGFHCVYHSPD